MKQTFILYADDSSLSVREKHLLASGAVNAYPVRFTFSSVWDGLVRTAVFRVGESSYSVPLDESGTCRIPWEVLKNSGVRLMAGVYGTRGCELIRPTVWTCLGVILPGTSPGRMSDFLPEQWAQALAEKADSLAYTPEGALGLYAGDQLLSAVPIRGNGEDGVSDHRVLTHRNAEAQHPIGAISGLEGRLSRLVAADDALSAIDIIKIMEG